MPHWSHCIFGMTFKNLRAALCCAAYSGIKHISCIHLTQSLIIQDSSPRGTWMSILQWGNMNLLQGECQWVTLEFPQSVTASELKVQFQGGFSAKTCRLEGKAQRLCFLVVSIIINGVLMWLSFIFSLHGINDFPLVFSAGCPKDGDFTVISHFYPEDNNSLQISFILII